MLEGWLVLELPAAFSDVDLYLVYGHAEWTDGIENMGPGMPRRSCAGLASRSA